MKTSVNVNASNATVFNAGVEDFTFSVASGNYRYDIAGFGTGDKIDFPSGNTPTVINSSVTDHALDLEFANAGNITTVRLTGLTDDQENNLVTLNAFKAAFPGSITTTGSATDGAANHTAVSATGSTNVSAGDVVLDFAKGNYTYNVTGFARGDVLNFPADVNPTVVSGPVTDNKVDLQWASDGSIITVSLAVTPEQDDAIFSLNSFKTVFGTGSIANAGTLPITPVTGSTTAVSGTGSAVATTGNVKFDFAAGKYNYTISGFSNGDVLNFPDDVTATIRNPIENNGTLDVEWATNGNQIVVTLTGLASDNAWSLNSFNTEFGPGSII